eukprot:gnl/MRDRNA2_/MRDRNA2_82754_c0_seq1.p1 gnl/MRDRNA2_/MRDRNA2_82754_c0~~gnl/MRDRNA2_/MRDRNA2_82754_c0_seq1.p1  ORF type:complete len:328 (+),score=61.24 gnl/MRDRNA2_/MRDRNA2_82754_c0_seq1:113-1096(+)
MVNFGIHASLLAMVASGLESDSLGSETTSMAGEITVGAGFEINSVAKEKYNMDADGLSEVAKSAQDSTDNQTVLMEWNIGAPVPPPVESFPGCHCDWKEPGWACEGSAVFPRLMAGEKCCCCGIHCKMGRRCTDEQCWSIGVDQGDEVREQERKWAEMLKNADFALNDELPVKIVDLEKGRCTNTGIENACRRYQMTPVCDHTAYIGMKRCYAPWRKGTKGYNRHFSHWSGHRQYMGLPEAVERRLPGTCFMANNGNWALTPNNNGHTWTAHGGNYGSSSIPYPPKVRTVHAGKIDQCVKEDQGGWGCWKTFCVPNEPNYNDPDFQR